MPERMRGSGARIAHVRRTPGRRRYGLDPNEEHRRSSGEQRSDAALEVSPVDRFDVDYVRRQFPALSRTSHNTNSGGFFATTEDTDRGILDMAATTDSRRGSTSARRSRQGGTADGTQLCRHARRRACGRGYRDRQRGDL